MLLTGANINMFMEREGPRPQSQVLTEAMLVFEIVLYPRHLKKQNKYKALASPPGLPRNRSQSDLPVLLIPGILGVVGCGTMFVTESLNV